MISGTVKTIAVPIALIVALAVVLSLVWQVPYIFTLIGLSAWAFFGHIITADDDMLGGWSNPDGKAPSIRPQLLLKAIVLGAICAIAIAFPTIRGLGG